MKALGIQGWSGSGKTALIITLIPLLVARGLRVSTIKHAHHSFDIDHPGKDSYEHRKAGAREVLISSAQRYALLHERHEDSPEPELPELLTKLGKVDLVLVEGFKKSPLPKIEVWRAKTGKKPLWHQDTHIFAVASPDPKPQNCPHDWLKLNDSPAIADYILRWHKNHGPT